MINRYEAEKLILAMADIVLENRQMRQEVEELKKQKKNIMVNYGRV